MRMGNEDDSRTYVLKSSMDLEIGLRNAHSLN